MPGEDEYHGAIAQLRNTGTLAAVSIKVRSVAGLFPGPTPIRCPSQEDVILGAGVQYLLLAPHEAETDEPFAIIKDRDGRVCTIAESVLVDEGSPTNAVSRHFIPPCAIQLRSMTF